MDARWLAWFPNGGCLLTISSNSLAFFSIILSNEVNPALTNVVLRVTPVYSGQRYVCIHALIIMSTKIPYQSYLSASLHVLNFPRVFI